MERQMVERMKARLREELSVCYEVSDEELYEKIDEMILAEARQSYLPLKQKSELRARMFDAFRRLDILQELVDDPEVTEIMVNGKDHIFIERHGQLSEWNGHFESETELEDMIQQIVSRINRTVNVAHPIADARLENGSRVHVVLPPLALDGPVVTIRKFPERIDAKRLLELGSVTEEALAFLCKLVRAGYNIFISGGTGSGKTSFLNALSGFIPEDERVITVEDSAELQILQVKNLVRLETRAANAEGEGAVEISDLIRASLRMRPTRIIVGEVRGKECLDMIQALNTGHAGSLSTGHGNNVRDMLSRLETMMLMGADLPLPAIRSQISAAIDIMVHLGRLRDKSRRVLEIAEIGGCENGEIQIYPLYRFEEGQDAGACEMAAGGSGNRAAIGNMPGSRTAKKGGRVQGTLKKVGELISVEKLQTAGYPI